MWWVGKGTADMYSLSRSWVYAGEGVEDQGRLLQVISVIVLGENIIL